MMSVDFSYYKDYFYPTTLYQHDKLNILEYNDTYIKINDDQYRIISFLKESDSLENFVEKLSEYYDNINIDNIYEYLDIIYHDIVQSINAKLKDYTHTDINIINSEKLVTLATKIQYFFKPHIFFIWFIIALITIIYFLINNNFRYNSVELHITDTFLMWPVFLMIGVIHELGHYAAASLVEKRKAKIYFAFYLFTPVFYTDVTYVWKGSKTQRIITNLAGYAIQTIPTIIVFIIADITNNSFIFSIALFSAIVIISDLLTPFGRGDSYWVISDFFNKENLQTHAADMFRTLFTQFKLIYEDKFVLIYGIINGLIIIISFYIAVMYAWNSIFFDLPLKILSLNFNFLYRDLIALGIYIFLIRLCIIGVIRLLYRYEKVKIMVRKISAKIRIKPY